MGRRSVGLIVRWPLIGLVAAMGLVTFPGLGRDLDGGYANEPLKPWFDQLKSDRGLCCSYADGYVIEDADWDAKDGHYRVRLPELVGSRDMIWLDVPENAVITEPNKAGRTMVWLEYISSPEGPSLYTYIASIRCFMPGSMT